MNKVLTSSRKAFTATVVAATISWSIGLSALVAPLSAKAAVSSGSLVKASLPAVYYVGSDMKRYVFPNEKTYKTWYADFSGVMTISDAELASMMIGGNVTYKPGTRMVKITTDPKVYVVDAHGVLRPIASEAVAAALYGSNWNQQIDDVPDGFFVNYSLGAAVNSASDFNRSAVSAAATSINVDKNLGSGSSAAGVSVSKASDSPAGATLPKGAMGVNFLKFNVSNGGSSAASINSVTVKRSGPGDAADFENVYLYRGAERLTTGRTVNSSTNEVTFGGLNISVAAGGSASMWVAADVSTGANVGDVNAFSVTSIMIGSNSVSGTPVMGSSFNIAGAQVGEVDIEETGTISNVKAGGTAQKVAQFKITAGSQEDIDLHSISLTFDGDSRSNVSNLVLKQAGLSLASTASISDKDLAVFALSSPMYMEKGASRTFEVFADIAAGSRAGDMISFYVDEDSDVRATGRTYGYGLMVNNSWAATDQDTEIEAGKLTTTFNGPASKDVSVNGKDVELYNFTMAAQSNLEVRQLVVKIDSSNDVNNIVSDVKVVDTASGAIVAGPKDNGFTTSNGTTACTTETTCYLVFNDTWSLASGSSRTFKVTADIVNDDAYDADLILVTLGDGNLFPNANKVRNLDNAAYLQNTDLVPSTQLQGNLHTVTTAMLTVDAASSPSATTYVKGSANVALGAWTFEAGDASSVKISSITFDCAMSDFSNCQDSISTVKLMNGASQIGSTESPDSSDMVVFDNLNLTINAGQTVTLGIYGNLSNSAAIANVQFAFNDADVQDEDGADLIEDIDTASGPVMAIIDEGDMTVVRASSDTDTKAGLVIAGSSNAVLAKFKFTASRENLAIKKLKLAVYGNSDAVSSLSLYDGSTLIASRGLNSFGEAAFSGMNVVVPKGVAGAKTLTVKANLVTTDEDGTSPVPYADVTITLVGDEYEFVGTTSSTVLDEGGDDIFDDLNGYEKYSVLSKPLVSRVGLSGALANSSQFNSMRFTVKADAAGDIALGTIKFNLTDDTDGTVACYNIAKSSIRESGLVLDGTCDITGSVVTVVFTDEVRINAGQSMTFDLLLAVSGVSDGSINLEVSDDSFTWSDLSLSGHDSTPGDGYSSNDWFSGAGTYIGLPSDAQSFTY